MGSCLSRNNEERVYYAPPCQPHTFMNIAVTTVHPVAPRVTTVHPVAPRVTTVHPVAPRVTTTPRVLEDEICFGKFRCGICQHHWASYRAWKNVEQKCEKCRVSTRPYFTKPLTREEKEMKTKCDPDRAHKTELCSKCRKIGGNCKQQGGKKHRY